MADRTESSIEIDAAPAAVLAVIADLEAYPEWAGGVQEVEVLAGKAGRPSKARFSVDSGPIRDSYVLDYTWKVTRSGPSLVSWTLDTAEVLSALDGSYEVVPSGEGSAVTYHLSVDLKIPMLGMLKRKAEKRIVDTALRDLRARVESQQA